MKISQLTDALGNIDDKLITDAIENDDGEFYPVAAKTEKRRIDTGVKAASAAAALVIAAAIPILINALGNISGPDSEVSGIEVDLDSSSSSDVAETSKPAETTTAHTTETSKPEETTTSVTETSKPEGTTTSAAETSKPEETTTSVTETSKPEGTTTTSVTETKPNKKPAQTSAADAQSSPENKDKEKFDADTHDLARRYYINVCSVDQLYKAFADKGSDEYKALRKVRDEYNNNPTYNIQKDADIFLSAIESGKEKLYIPKINNKDVELCEKGSDTDIHFLSNCDYMLPTILYRVYVKDEYLFISSSFPKICGIKGIENKKSAAEVLSVVSPNATLPNNDVYYEDILSMYEKEVTLANNFKTTALFRIYKDDPDEMNVIIYKDGVLTLLRANKNLFTDSFFASFDIAEYN